MFGLSEKINRLEQLVNQSELQAVDSDQLLIMNGISWQMYEAFLESLGDSPWFRVTYLEGTLEIMSPSRRHEFNKKIIALLLETYFLETGIDFYPLGSTTFRKQTAARGIEPDECYCIDSEKSVPDIAIEVVVTSGGIDSLEVYKGLKVPEVWFGKITNFLCTICAVKSMRQYLKVSFCPN
jgi:Uma2 family endonuclease